MSTHSEELMQHKLTTEIGSLVILQRMCERIGDANITKRPTLAAHMESLDDQENIQRFLIELEEWRQSTPDHVRSCSM